jgi:hypothetical protein
MLADRKLCAKVVTIKLNKKQSMKRFNDLFRVVTISVMLISLTLIGCKDNEVTQAVDNTEISMMSSPGVTDNAINSLVLDSVKILLKNIKLNVSAASSDSVNFKTGPFALKLNLNSSVNLFTTAMIPEGSYDKVKFEIHKLEDGEVANIDTAFSFGGGRYSVVVYGKFNLIPFIYRSTKSAHQKLTFTPAITVNSQTKSNITLTVQPYTWFWTGSDYLDPMLASNENDIDNKIKASFKAIKDNDKNGVPD